MSLLRIDNQSLVIKLSCLLDVKCLSFRTNDYRTRIAGSANRECHILCQIQLTICVPRTVVSLVSVTDRYSPTGKMKEREIVDLVDLCSWKTSQLPPSTKSGGCHIYIPYPPSSHTQIVLDEGNFLVPFPPFHPVFSIVVYG